MDNRHPGCSRISKITILKAIHNCWCSHVSQELLFAYLKDNNFESDSQPRTVRHCSWSSCSRISKITILKAIHNILNACIYGSLLFAYLKDNNFESDSQQLFDELERMRRCSRISKITILKAIHNRSGLLESGTLLFAYLKDNNFESDSQLRCHTAIAQPCCSRISKITILKAIHNANI